TGAGNGVTVKGSFISVNAGQAISMGFAAITSTNQLFMSTFGGALTDTGGSALSSTNSTVSLTGKSVTIGQSAASTVSVKWGLSLTAQAGGSAGVLNGSSAMVTGFGILSISGPQSVTLDGTIQAGALAGGAPLTGVLAPLEVGGLNGTINI